MTSRKDWDMYPKPGMSFDDPYFTINAKDYQEIISIGNKCATAIMLRDMKIYKQSYPFDFVSSTPKLILKYLKDTTEFFPKRGETHTKDLVFFGHFDVHTKYEETIETFKRRFERLFTALKEKKRILFVYTSAADIYNEMGNGKSDNYGDLIKLQDYIIQTYGYDNFTILAVHINKDCPNTKNIINFSMNIDQKYLSDNMETHLPEIYYPFRTTLIHFMRKVFGV